MIRKIFILATIAIFCGGVFALTAPAQNKKMNQTEDFRKTAPTPLAPRSINLPKPEETILPNGLKVVFVEDKRLPIVSYRLAFKSGSSLEPAEMSGLASMTASMLTEGTATRTSRQIAEEVERIGGSLSANAGADNTVVAASALSNYSGDILRLMADVVLNPAFPEKELSLAKQNTLQNLQYQRSQPGFLADERTALVIYGQTHPYSRVSATPEAVQAMTRERLAAFHKQTFIPNNAVLVVVGDVNRTQLMKDIETLFGKWGKGAATTANFPQLPARFARGIYVVDRPGSAQSNIVLANVAIERTNPDYFPVLVMNQVLGGGASSRLFMNLREEKGYTYGAYSSFDMRRQAGNFEATAEVRTDVTGASLKEFFAELNEIRAGAVPEQELQDAKNYLTGVFPIRLETQEGLINQLVAMQMFNLPADYLTTYRDRINAVSPADVQRVAQKHITPDKIAIVIVGDAAKIADQIKPFGETIEYYEASGRKKEMNKPSNTNGNNAGAPASAEGAWTLTVNTPQGDLPISMTLKTENGKLGGTINSPLFGSAPVTGGSVDGNKVRAVSSINFQGRAVDVTINGVITGSEMKGSVTASIPGIPELPFTGTKSN